LPEHVVTTQAANEARDPADVRRTVFEFGDARIELSSKDDLCLLKVEGLWTTRLGQEIEKAATRCRGNIGLVFEGIRRAPNAKTATKFDSRIVRVLKTLQTRCDKRGFQFFICKPPAELIDALKLFGGLDQFEIVDDISERLPPSRDLLATAPAPPRRGEHESRDVGRKIYSLDVSLQRTDSLEKELDSAAECVARFLPRSAPAAPGYEIAFAYRSCEKVGGDFFDFVTLDERSLGIAIGDVSGHGLDAALVMGISKKLINIRARDPSLRSPAAVLRQVNDDLVGDLDRKTFVTAVYGVLDLLAGEYRFARAGHEYPVLFRPGGAQHTLKTRGLALGMANARVFAAAGQDSLVRLGPGDCLLLVTDGLAECRNDKNSLYSRERLLFELSQADRGWPAQELLDRLLETIVSFANGSSQEDDMTAILIKRAEG